MNETRPRRPPRAARPVEANARLTGTTSAVLLLLFCVEVATVVLGIRSMLTLHVMVGLLLVPPLLVKISSVSWRFFRYYRHDQAYRREGPPAPALRILGPVLLAATLMLFTSGITLLLAPGAFGGSLKHIHGDTFYAWLLLMFAHVLAHARDLRRLAARDWMRRTRAAVSGAVVRQLAILASLALGLALALSLVAHVGTYRHHISPVRGTTAAVPQTSRVESSAIGAIAPVMRAAASTTVARWRSGSVRPVTGDTNHGPFDRKRFLKLRTARDRRSRLVTVIVHYALKLGRLSCPLHH